MPEPTLLVLALAAQDAYARLAASADTFPEEGRFLAGEVEKKLNMLVDAVRRREARVDALHEALADRMNNLLMAIRTASDLLRAEGDPSTTPTRDRLDATVETGRAAVKKLRDALDDVR